MLKHNLKIEPYAYQQEGILKGLEWKRLILGDEPGLGKCQSLDSIVYTPDGAIRMGDIMKGSRIFGADGNVYAVEQIYPQGIKSMYCITFSDGSRTKCTLDHLWNVRDENRRRRNTGWVTKTLEELLLSGLQLRQNRNRKESGRMPVNKWEIPMCLPVQYQHKNYILPPYTMGAYLGDGSLNGSHIDFSLPNEKRCIIDIILKELPSTLRVKIYPHGNVHKYSIVNNDSIDKYHTRNAFGSEINSLNLAVNSGKKFIPEVYKYGSIDQRTKLLAGLMDTDGSCLMNRTVFHSTSFRLSSDVKELVQSLGGVAIINKYDRIDEGKTVEYRVTIRTSFCPFSSNSPKLASWKPNKRFKVTRYIQSVDYIGEELCQCIKVSAPDELYLTDEYIVTHNTLQSIGIIDTANAYPALVICPSSLKINWQREVDKFTNKKAVILDNSNRTTWPYLLQMKMFQVAIVNYESLKKYFVWDVKGGKLKDIVFSPQVSMFKSVIIDESHRVKDTSAQQTKFTKGICNGKEWIILLTGTPVVNRPADLVAQLSIMDRLSEFGGKGNFLLSYAGGKREASNLGQLSSELYSRCLIRREKSKVLKELPDKTRVDLYVDISNREEYQTAAEDLAKYLREYKECSEWEIKKKMRMEALVKFMALRSLSSKGKVAQAIDFVKTFLENGKKLVLFCSLHEIVDSLKKAFPKAVTVTGRDSQFMKQAAVDAFQQREDVTLIICSIKAAGVGLTLTASSNVAFVEFPWTYADCCQCEDRCHRIGQKDNVTCYYLLGDNTIDHYLYHIINNKKSIANQIMASNDDIPTSQLYFDELAEMFSS